MWKTATVDGWVMIDGNGGYAVAKTGWERAAPGYEAGACRALAGVGGGRSSCSWRGGKLWAMFDRTNVLQTSLFMTSV